jgi:hypothetical protein
MRFLQERTAAWVSSVRVEVVSYQFPVELGAIQVRKSSTYSTSLHSLPLGTCMSSSSGYVPMIASCW